MAEETVKKFEEHLNCSICLEIYNNPKLLDCFHAYCQKCLVKLVVRDQQGRLVLICPICRRDTPVPANGVAGLRAAFQFNPLVEILEEHKKAVASLPADGEVVKRDLSVSSHDKIKVCCPEHGGREVKLYCETCEDTICTKCALKGGKHHSHDYEELDKAFEKYKVEIAASLKPMEEQLASTKKALVQLDTRCGEISSQQEGIEDDIHNTFQQIQELLDARKAQLVSQLHQITQSKLKCVEVQKDKLETTQAQLSSCLEFMKESLKSERRDQVLMMKTMVIKQIKQLTSPISLDILEPSAEANLVLSTPANFTAACQNYGQVSTSSSPDPSKCYATGKGTEVAVVGETSTAVLQVNIVRVMSQ